MFLRNLKNWYSFSRAWLEMIGRTFAECIMSSCSFLKYISQISDSYHRYLVMKKKGRGKQTDKKRKKEKCYSVSVSLSVESGGSTGMRKELTRVNAWITVSVAHGCDAMRKPYLSLRK